jgi:hypothetical protein
LDFSRVTFGEAVAAGSGLALFILMFLPWFGVSEDPVSESYNAWASFGLIDYLLFLAVVIAIGQAIVRAADAMPELGQPPGAIVAGAGGFALLLIFFRLISTPEVDFLGQSVASDRKIGVLLGLFAAAGIAYGGYTSIDERLDQEFAATRVESRPRPR